MRMVIEISQDDIYEAVCDWLNNAHKVHVTKDKLQPVFETEGCYEDQIKVQTGFKVVLSENQ